MQVKHTSVTDVLFPSGHSDTSFHCGIYEHQRKGKYSFSISFHVITGLQDVDPTTQSKLKDL